MFSVAVCAVVSVVGVAPQLSAEIAVLRRCSAVDSRPSVADATRALSVVANGGARPESWETALSACSWKPVFSAKPAALKGVGADDADAPLGRYLGVSASQSFTSDGRIENEVRLLWGLMRLAFLGAYVMNGRAMRITFETLRVKLGIIGFSLDIREGRGLRGLIERVRGPSAAGKKRPNVYRWCYADDRVCVAQGTSGSVAVWAAE
jgi:hypothetical protein